MSQASIYLHPPLAEHFGIAIAEAAAAAGLVPVVYRDGGGWTDIASRIDQGLGTQALTRLLISLGRYLTTQGG